MEHKISEMLEHMSHSTHHLARVLEAERHVTVRLSEIVQALPDVEPNIGDASDMIEHTQGIAQNLIGYLNSFADFQETLAAQLAIVIRGLKEAEDEE